MKKLETGYGRHTKPVIIDEINNHISAQIELTRGLSTTISACDLDILLEHNFYAHRRTDGKYVARSTKGQYLHRLLLNPNEDQEIDHVDSDPLNNTRGNLRVCSTRQNNLAKNSTKHMYKGFYGIRRRSDGYSAIDANGKLYGLYSSPERAAKVRDELMMEEYYHRYYEEEFHSYGFIRWNDYLNFPHTAKLIESEDYLFDQIQEAQIESYHYLNDKGWWDSL